MKFQPKRFVVEVKRGTSRASFASPDASANKFGDAEAALFGSKGRVDAAPSSSEPVDPGRAEAPSGRILRSLVEPPPPVEEDLASPIRRGRKPGSKNKPKPRAEAAPTAEADRPRRGRKPGSKNKPKPQVPTPFPASATSPGGSAAAMRSYGFSDDGTVWTAPKSPATVEQAPPPPPADPASAARSVAEAASERARPYVRLRDRSSILKRYVLDTEPRPGQPGAIRARRLARTV